MLRVVLFAATNVAVLIVLSIFSRIFGLEQSLGAGNLNALLIMSAVIGMAGSVISLLMSKTMAKRGVGARVAWVGGDRHQPEANSPAARSRSDDGPL